MELPKRKQIRLREFDYSSVGAYFVTICTNSRQCLFGTICEQKMCYNLWGEIADHQIVVTNELRRKSNIQIVKYVVMPNHVHLLIEILPDVSFFVGTRRAVSENEQFEQFSKPTKQSVSTVIRAYKAAVTKEIHQMMDRAECRNGHGTPCPYGKSNGIPIWQARFYEHIVRNAEDYKQIWRYIDENPLVWEKDCFYENRDNCL